MRVSRAHAAGAIALTALAAFASASAGPAAAARTVGAPRAAHPPGPERPARDAIPGRAAGRAIYSHAVYSLIRVSGEATPGFSTSYVPAPCWVEPRFTGSQSYIPGDPQVPYSPGVDADTYWWWFAQQQPGMIYLLGHTPGARKQINEAFRRDQGSPGWWWVPAWLDDSAGYACAQGLVDQLIFNNAYLELAPPGTGGGDTPGHTIDGQILADLARAALALPALTVRTSPSAPAEPSDVNLPTWVWVAYHGPMSPRDEASVPLPGGGVLSATVRASRPAVTLSVSGPAAAQAEVYNHCGARGSRYPGPAQAGAGTIPPCGVTFLSPSTAGPFTITATARWTVTWSDSTGRAGGFPSPPWPPAVMSASVSVTVREIQAVNRG